MAIEIDVKLADNRGLNSAITKLENAISKVEETVHSLNNALRETATLAGAAASSISGMGGTGTRAASSGARSTASRGRSARSGPPPIIDPVLAQASARAGVLAGDPESVKQFLQAQRIINARNRAQKLISGETMDDVFARTRFVQVAGQMIPLPLGRDMASWVGKMGNLGGAAAKMMGGMSGGAAGAGAAGAGAAGAGVGGAAGLSTSAIALGGVFAILAAQAIAYTSAVVAGTAAMQKLAQQTAALGGTMAQTQGAATAAGALGMGPGDIASIVGRIASDPRAMQVGARAGVSPIRGYYGDINDAEAFRKIVRYLGSLPYEQARREAVGLGAPGLSSVALMSQGLQGRLVGGSSLSARDMQGVAEFSGELAVLRREFDTSLMKAAIPAIEALTPAIRGMSEAVKLAGNAFNMASAGVKGWLMVLGRFWDALANFYAWINEKIKELRGESNKKDNEELRELKDINRGIKDLNDGIYGGGPRARGASFGPRGNPAELDRAIQGRALPGGIL
jgi:hypothetical protein